MAHDRPRGFQPPKPSNAYAPKQRRGSRDLRAALESGELHRFIPGMSRAPEKRGLICDLCPEVFDDSVKYVMHVSRDHKQPQTVQTDTLRVFNEMKDYQFRFGKQPVMKVAEARKFLKSKGMLSW